MSNQLCPHCNVLRDMVVSTHEKEDKYEDGKLYKVITYSYHCSLCNTFVYSTDTKVPKAN